MIGRGTKLDNLVHVGHNVRIGENVVIAAQTGISGSAVIEDGAVIAGQVGIADHVTVESGAILGAQCGVPTGKVIRGKGIAVLGNAGAADQAVFERAGGAGETGEKIVLRSLVAGYVPGCDPAGFAATRTTS